MNNKRLRQTHTKLTLLFTGVVFFLVLLIGSIFLGARYIHESKQGEKDFLIEVQDLRSKMQLQEDFFEKFEDFKNLGRGTMFRDLKNRKRMFPTANSVSFIVFSRENNTIEYKYLLQEPDFDDLKFKKRNFYRDNGFIIAVRNIGDNTAVFYKRTKNSIDGLIFDESFLLVLALLFSGVFYLAGYSFIGRVLAPVEENMQDMQDFIHHAGHELKTPLAVVRGNLQIMKSEKNLDPKLIKNSISEIDTSNNLIEGLREIAETGKLRDKKNYALSIEVQKVVSELQALAEKKKISISNGAQGPLIVKANISELHILLKNLIQNAIKYSDAEGKVEILLHKNILTVKDNGKGIHKDEQERIFERFYKGNQARSEEGFGIGLALVKKIGDANKWKIDLESEEGKGSEFRVTF